MTEGSLMIVDSFCYPGDLISLVGGGCSGIIAARKSLEILSLIVTKGFCPKINDELHEICAP